MSLSGCRDKEKPGTGAVAQNAPVILISIDTLRSDHLPMYGYRGVETPGLNALRRDSILFEKAYSHCPMTLPSHISMLTGLLPTEHHVRNNLGYRFRSSEIPSLPSLLSKRGYTTGAAVSSYVLRGETGLSAIFDWYEDDIKPDPGATFVDYQRSGPDTAALALKWIEQNQKKPFFFFLHLYEPHVPYAPPEPFASRYPNRYDGEIAAADHVVANFLDGLKKLGLYDRAIIVLTSDHGEGLGEHGEDQHSILLYRESIQVPLVVKLPASERGGTSTPWPAQHADIAPTLLEILGITGTKMTGSSLLTLNSVRPIYAETMYPRIQLGWSELTSVIEYPWQLIESSRPELYDLSRDPSGINDLTASDRRKTSNLRTWLTGRQVPLQSLDQVDPETAAKLTALGYIGAPSLGGTGSALNPRDAIAIFPRMQEAFKLVGAGRLSQALAALKQLSSEHPETVELWVKTGEVYSELGMFKEAANAWQEAIRRTPVFSPEYAYAAGEALIRSGDHAKAGPYAGLLIREEPAKAHELMARAALAGNDLRKADEEARLAAASDRDDSSRMLLVAEVAQREGRFAEALEMLKSIDARRVSEQSGPLHRLEFLRGDTLARMGQLVEAEAAYRRELASFPNSGQAYANLAVIYFLEGRSGEADKLFSDLVRSNPSEANFMLAEKTFRVLEDTSRANRWRERLRAAQRQESR